MVEWIQHAIRVDVCGFHERRTHTDGEEFREVVRTGGGDKQRDDVRRVGIARLEERFLTPQDSVRNDKQFSVSP
jgi:hypothetical protein